MISLYERTTKPPCLLRDGKPWLPHEDALLGTDTDRAIATKLGRTTVSVSNRRKTLGIKRPNPPRAGDRRTDRRRTYIREVSISQ